jgi:hypothetical protein
MAPVSACSFKGLVLGTTVPQRRRVSGNEVTHQGRAPHGLQVHHAPGQPGRRLPSLRASPGEGAGAY